VKRGTDRMEGMGADWRRILRFRIPVRKLGVWNTPEVLNCLIETLCFLSEDQITVELEQGDPQAMLDPFLGFQDPAAQRLRPDDVILFSGGLDSLAGAVEQLVEKKRTAVLVTHKSSTNIAGRQDALAGELEKKARKRLFYAPVWVRKGDYEPVEHTQRTRSFLFVSLGVAVARMFERDVVQFFENGITSFNLPIAEHVVGTRASRTTHPKVLSSFSRLFSLLAQRTVSIENRYIWHTKRDVLEVLRANGCAELIGSTTSCAQVRNLSMTAKQCGVCSQCIERRYAVLAANLEEHEAADTYATDLFTGPHTKPTHITMAEQHLSRAKRFETISEHSFLATYGQVFRSLPYLPGGASDNATKVFELHQRYGREIMGVVNSELRRNAEFDQVLEIPSTSLLAMIGAPTGVEAPATDPSETEPAASTQAALNPTTVKDRRFAITVDDAAKKILFSHGPKLTGASFLLVARLVQPFRSDLDSGADPQSFKYVPTKTLMHDLGATEHTVGQRVLRVRNLLREQFLAAINYIIDDEDIIQSKSWNGYRLNPYLMLVPPLQLQSDRNLMTSSRNVMTRPAHH
jgi:hypothetical protein